MASKGLSTWISCTNEGSELMRKKVLITGAAQGLGKSIAIEFAEHDYDVVITYLNSVEEAQKLRSHLMENYEGTFEIVKLDLRDENACRQFGKNMNRLDVLVNNAAFNEDKNYDEFDTKDFIDTYKVNVVGPYLLSMSCEQALKEANGSIINISSSNAIDTMYKESIPYDASKSALINLTKNLSVAMTPVRVNAIAPGWIDTPSTKDMEPKFKKRAENSSLMHRFATPEEIAKTVYFVANDATYMTGSTIILDGGNYYGNEKDN